MHDREELHDAEYIDEGAFKAATTIGRIAANVMGFGKVSSRAARGAGVSTLRVLTRRGSEAFQRGIRRANWTPGKALPSGTPAGVRDSALKSLTKGSKSKSGGLVAPGKGGPLKTTGKSGGLVASGKGGPLKTTGKTAGLGPVSKIEPVKVKDLGSSRVAAGKTKAETAAAGTKGTGVTYQGTRSGGQLPGKDVKALPGVGQASTRRNLAQQKAADAAKGSTAVGTRYTSQGVRQLGPEKLSSQVKRTVSNLKNAVTGAGAATVKGVKKGASAVNKLPRGAKLAGGAALVGLAAAGLSGDGKDPLAKKTGELNLPKDTAPTTPPGGALADKGDTKGPGGYTVPDDAKPKTGGSVGKTFDPGKDLVPKSKTPRKLSKMERDARELKQMRARSLDRQGRSSDAEKLRAEIKKKYG